MSSPKSALPVVVGIVLLLTGGCLSARQRDLLTRQPSDRVLEPQEFQLPEGEPYSYAERTSSGSQDLVVLQLDPDYRLNKRFHKEHDVTLFVARGRAIVTVEDTRYTVEQGAAVALPRYTAYSVLPQEQEEPLVLMMVFSPPYDGEDVHLLE